jgi:hypothetical protein
LPPPAASVVYELTDHARGLAPVLAAPADWGMNLLVNSTKTTRSSAAGWYWVSP